MTGFFLTVLNMSIVAGYIILLLFPIRLLLRKVPKNLLYGLWGVALFRLLVPVSFESAWSLVVVSPQTVPQDIVYAQAPRIQSGINALDSTVNASLPAGTPYASINPIQVFLGIAAAVWVAGMAVLLLRGLVSTLRLRCLLRSAEHLDGNVYQSGLIHAPFVFGVLHPRIYLSTNLDVPQRELVLRHEQAHIRRRDPIVKLLFYIALCVHWFNPLVWLAFRSMSRDMEMCCDERVMKELDAEEKRLYSQTLLSLAAGRQLWSVSPLAFGENDVKSRIKNILAYKKPVVWLSAIGVAVAAVAGVGLLANPSSAKTAGDPGEGREAVSASILEREESSGIDRAQTGFPPAEVSGSPTGGDSWRDALDSLFAQYASHGLQYDKARDKAVYNGEPVRLFVAYEAGSGGAIQLFWHDPDDDGALCLESTQNPGGARAVYEMGLEAARSHLGYYAMGEVDTAHPGVTSSYVSDGVQVIEAEGVIIREIDRSELPDGLRGWAEECDRLEGGDYLSDHLPGQDGHDLYLYVTKGGPYSWYITAVESTMVIRLYENEQTADIGYQLLHIHVPRLYQEYRIWTGDSDGWLVEIAGEE